MPDFAPQTIEDLIAHWEKMAADYSKDHQHFEKLGLDTHAQQAYGKMIGMRTAIAHSRIALANA